AATFAPDRTTADHRAVAIWLLVCAAMIFAMVVLGGITRLTESGLSLTDWNPVTGNLPPLSDAAWQAEFARYREIPQFRAIHSWMTVADFKAIFFWEWLHRLWGRLIGFVFAIPFVWFLWRGRVAPSLRPRLFGLLVLGGLQGLLGWVMVQSGLSDGIEVSQYRLVAHLALAVAIYAAILWTALGLLWPATAHAPAALRRGAGAIVALVFVTLCAGGFVAGLRAGFIDNTFPLMDGSFVPPDYLALTPWWRNWFENAAAAQFDHRILAETTGGVVLVLWLAARRIVLPRRARVALHALLAAAALQLGLGIATLLLVVPVPLGVAHQAGALLLFTAALIASHALGTGWRRGALTEPPAALLD
ncbi:MAG: heme synthase, partial [Rhodospirillales bacterium]|nr:heme synthase [Rhodospirillales bacterium]